MRPPLPRGRPKPTVLKPAEQTPLTALAIARIAQEVGFTDGVINVVPGYVPRAGAALSGHMNVGKIAFTGETGTGRIVTTAAAASNLKRVSLEPRGIPPNVVFADADLDAAAEGADFGLFVNRAGATWPAAGCASERACTTSTWQKWRPRRPGGWSATRSTRRPTRGRR